MSTDRHRIERGHRAKVAIGPGGPVRVAFAGALLLGALASCGPAEPSGVQPSAVSTQSGLPASSSPAAAPALTPSGPPASRLPPSPGAATASTGSIERIDPSADAAPGFIDIVRLGAEPGEESISLALSLAAAVPTDTSAVGQLAYRFYLDTDGDGTWDHMAALEAVPGGGFVPVLVGRLPGRRLEGARYPGTASQSGQLVSMTVRLAEIGCPSIIRAQAVAEQTKGGSTTRDEVPDVASDWIRIDTGCQAQ